MALMQITIIPLGTATPSVGKYVADVVMMLNSRKIPYTLNDMGTIIEGEPADLLRLAAEIHELPFKTGAERVVTNIVMDERRDRKVRIGDKHRSVLDMVEKEGNEG